MKKTGRPPLPMGQAKTRGFQVRVTEAEYELLKTAALSYDIAGVATWARLALVKSAKDRLVEPDQTG